MQNKLTRLIVAIGLVPFALSAQETDTFSLTALIPRDKAKLQKFGVHESGDVLTLSVQPQANVIMRHSSITGGQTVWMAPKSDGAFVTTGTIPQDLSGVHNGTFKGEYKYIGQGGSGAGTDQWFPWDLEAEALVVRVKNDDSILIKDAITYITAAPTMPILSAELFPKNNLEGNTEWRVAIEYLRTDRGDYSGDKTYYPGPDESGWKTLPATQVWDLNQEFADDVRGGRVTVFNRMNGNEHSFVFHIRGTNPSESTAKQYIDSFGFWFGYAIAKHEGGVQKNRHYLQFNENGPIGPGWDDYGRAPNRGRYDNGSYITYGWGMMQLDNIELPGQFKYREPDRGEPWAQELWSWKSNVDTAIQVIKRSREKAIAHLKSIAPDGAGGYIMPPDITIAGVSMTVAGPRTPDSCEIIKRYNSGKFYTNYNQRTGEFDHVQVAGDYVEKVLKEM